MGLVSVIKDAVTEACGGAGYEGFSIENAVVVEIDCLLGVNHVKSQTPTSSPIETGSSITDHVIKDPASFEMTGFVSDDPVKSLIDDAIEGALEGGVSGAIGAVAGSVATMAEKAVGIEEPRSVTQYNKLKEIFDNDHLVTVIDKFEVYENMMLVNLSAPRNAAIGNALEFDAKWQQVTYAEVSAEKIQSGGSGLSDMASGAAKMGKQAAASAGKTAATAAGASSVLGSMGSAFGL